jgi:two-component system chemotaxis response regulator CheY
MRTLVVEDDFSSRKLAQKILENYGKCDVAVNGNEAIRAFVEAHAEKDPYDLILLDIMMPEKNGQEVLHEIREREAQMNILGLDGAKILMTTALNDKENIMMAFREQCEGYLVKPVTKEKIRAQLQDLELIK